jgi:hypothetical protein
VRDPAGNGESNLGLYVRNLQKRSGGGG